MEIFQTRWFARWARKQGMTTQVLADAVSEMRAGLIDADLGSGLYKKRVAREGQGKTGGFRTLVATNRDSRWIFVYGFAKNERSNIDRDEEIALKALASHLLLLSPKTLKSAVDAGELIEVISNAQN